MTTETLMTTEAATTTEGAAASTEATQQAATGAEAGGQPQEAGTQAQGVEGAPAEGGQGEAEQQPAGAPEQYEFQAPEGRQFDEQVIGAFSEVAKELNLPQESAQKVLDKVAPVIAARQAEQLAAARSAWADTAKTDQEFGGDKLTENLAVATKALETFGTPELKALLNESGLGNHPEVIRVFYRAGKAISEDRFVGGQGGESGSKSVAQRMYPNMNP